MLVVHRWRQFRQVHTTYRGLYAELKQTVEAVFSHMPQKGPEKILWPLVWRQFCLCYQGQKLVSETNYIRDYGIKDGDQVCVSR
ncbi:hypothetical protein JHK82_031797 [Glycine max]|nr:hypothetical protein JHK85_032456 [Glycine max]KAG4995062.1 hypothetical protein JHK86_031889 [Glycine max]KAG5125060.1 hypothetical protein JHK82_031797 [Glycine max]KAG5146486.1 hypothetical protein JHK84_032029 [Glycine max]